jgi:hypothetical protein
VLGPVFWDKDEILLIDYLDELKQQLVSKYRGKLLKGIYFFRTILLLTRRP